MLVRILSVAVLAAASLPAQAFNTTLLGRHDQHGTYNDVWGYAAPNGKEYALLGTRTGVAVIDVTVPTNPVERGFFSGPASTWRDIRTYSTYAYAVTEATGGIQVIDLTNPDAPALVGQLHSGVFGNAHNISVDPATGRIYVVGTNVGTVVFDASANPANPSLVGIYGTGSNSWYIHDFQAQNGLGFASMIWNGRLRILDTTVWPMTTISEFATPSAFTHQAWPNANNTLLVTDDERTGGLMQIYDISNPASPVARGSFTPNPAAIPHNHFVTGNLVHGAWYTEGYRLIDISDPNNPQEVAYYDTWPGASGGFNGAWGVYPFLPSGHVLVSDISTGLYVVRIDLGALRIQHTPLGDTGDEIGPYRVSATVTSSNPITAVNLHWSTDGQNFSVLPMNPTGTPDEFAADIPGQLAPTFVSYHIEAIDSQGNRRDPVNGEHRFFVGSRRSVFQDDFETNSGWTHGLIATQDDWQRGTPAGRSGTSGGLAWSDPSSAVSGTNVWGNDLGPSGFNGAYQPNVSNWLQSPSFSTGGVQNLRLRFQRWLTVANGDTARVLVNGTVVWQNPSGANTIDTGWSEVEYDLSPILNSASSATIRFELMSNGSVNLGGWNIDDVEVFALSDCVPPQHYGAGTAGTGGVVPAIGLNGDPRIGQSFQVTGSALLGGIPSFLVIGFQQANNPTFGITGLVDPTTAAFLFQVAGGPTGLPGAGTAAWPFSIPASSALDNMDLFNQVLTLDPGGPMGLAASDGMRFRVCSQ